MRSVITGDIEAVARHLAGGGIAGVPTETVYGLAANATDGQAVLKIFEAKERPRFNPVIVHVKDAGEFGKYGTDIPDEVYLLAEKFSPGPVSFIVKKKNLIPDIVTAGNETVAFRIPCHPVFQELLKKCGFPLAAPSANMFGRISPTTSEETLAELDGRVPFILEGGKCRIGIESTVIMFEGKTPVILRHGGISPEEIAAELGIRPGDIKNRTMEQVSPVSPGMLYSHYAPENPLLIAEEPVSDEMLDRLKAGYLDPVKFRDKKDMAFNMYSELRRLDASGCSMIICRLVDEAGIGSAINDRLQRASKGSISIRDGSPVIRNYRNV